uniref:Anaphylatoxin-like domain-containing protein n=1 Tax=Romanomermis culicivorax TaxID=13658 RepID=A0A915JL92_ROMCU
MFLFKEKSTIPKAWARKAYIHLQLQNYQFLKMRVLQYFLIFIFVFVISAYSFNEINRCCNDGSRTYAIQGSCPLDISTMARTVFGSSCSRAASVCCLKSLFEKHCTLGEEKAQTYSLCVAGHHAETYGAGYERKCCECCLLARQMIRDGRQCQPLSTFDILCKRSFENCCRQDDDHRSTSSIVVTHSFAPTGEIVLIIIMSSTLLGVMS